MIKNNTMAPMENGRVGTPYAFGMNSIIIYGLLVKLLFYELYCNL